MYKFIRDLSEEWCQTSNRYLGQMWLVIINNLVYIPFLFLFFSFYENPVKNVEWDDPNLRQQTYAKLPANFGGKMLKFAIIITVCMMKFAIATW